MIAETKNKSSG